MNILFCHDGPVNCDKANRYFSIGFNDKIFERYASVFGNVGAITRVNRSNKSAYVEAQKLTVENHPVVEYPNYLNLRGIFANKAQSTKHLEKSISECDALIIRLPSFLGSKCVKIANKYKKPYMIELVGCPWDAMWNHGPSGKLLAPYLWFITRYQVKRATDVLYVTSNFLQKRYPTLGRQIACSDVELKNDSQNEIVTDLAHNRKEEKKIIFGSIGKIDLKYKGHSTVIDVVADMKALGYDVEYQIVGSGDKSNLEKHAKQKGVEENVIFTGPMGHDSIFEWLDTIDVYIQPSLTEGMPRALIEAMSRGCPCIASDAGGMPELLEEKYIYPKGNAKQLESILLNAEKNGLYEHGARNKEFTKQFTPEVIKEKRIKFYQEFKEYVMGRLQNE